MVLVTDAEVATDDRVTIGARNSRSLDGIVTMEIYRGIVTAYDATNHKADVWLSGGMSGIVLGVPVSYQVAPEQMAANVACGVMFFGEGDAGVVVCTFGEVPVPPLDLDVLGPTLDVFDLLRMWNDNFMGKALHEQYQASSYGTGSGAALLNWHGGWYNMWGGAEVGAGHRLYLGDSANTYASLCSVNKWVMATRMCFGTTTDVDGGLGATEPVWSNFILAGIHTGLVASNWVLQTRSGGGSINVVDTGVATDGDGHWHGLEVTPGKVKYYLDGELIANTSTSVPGMTLTPTVGVNSLAAAVSQIVLDTLIVIPG